jgi:hypothetical protein
MLDIDMLHIGVIPYTYHIRNMQDAMCGMEQDAMNMQHAMYRLDVITCCSMRCMIHVAA